MTDHNLPGVPHYHANSGGDDGAAQAPPRIQDLQDQLMAMQAQLRNQQDAYANLLQTIQNINPPTPQPSTSRPTTIDDLGHYLQRLTVGGTSAIDRIDFYRGGIDYDMFVDSIETLVHQNNLTEMEAVRIMVSKFKDRAKDFYLALTPRERPQTINDMRAWLKRVFAKALNKGVGISELNRCLREEDESLGAYVQRLKIIASRIFPIDNMSPAEVYYRDKVLAEQFIQGVDLRLANEILREGEVFNIDVALDIAEKYDGIVCRQLYENKYSNVKSSIRAVNYQDPKMLEPTYLRNNNFRPQADFQNPPNFVNFPGHGDFAGKPAAQPFYNNRKQVVNKKFDNPKNTGNSAAKFPNMSGRCFKCGVYGHYKISCRLPQQKFCFNCLVYNDHLAPMCPSSNLNLQRPARQPAD